MTIVQDQSQYEFELRQNENARFQWRVNLFKHEGQFVVNRSWRSVGKEFESRSTAIHWYEQPEHKNELIQEYDGLHQDEIEIQLKMGRPSQGRSVRLQASVTPDLQAWLREQREPNDKSDSDVVFRLLNNLRQANNDLGG